MKFIFSFFGLVDFLAILPFYLSFGVDLRTLRAFRLLRLFKILRLPKYARAIRRIRLALIKEEMILFFVALRCFAVLLFRLGVISIPAGLIAPALSEARGIADDQAKGSASDPTKPEL